MTQPKHIANSLKTLLDNPIVLTALDRSVDIETAAELAVNFWNYDLFSRKPSPAYDGYGIFRGTDLDLACFLYALVGRNAVINIPRYKAATVRTERADEKLASKTNRHGRLMGVKANKDFQYFHNRRKRDQTRHCRRLADLFPDRL
jgi:hypothetical protein